MAFPIKICVVCEEEFELRPDKPGYANRCPTCTEAGTSPGAGPANRKSADELQYEKEANAARRKAIRDLLYRKDS
jgi:hypothetical protein